MNVSWKDSFFAGFTYNDLYIDGEKVLGMGYTIEHMSPPKPNKIKIDKTGQLVNSEAEAKKIILAMQNV